MCGNGHPQNTVCIRGSSRNFLNILISGPLTRKFLEVVHLLRRVYKLEIAIETISGQMSEYSFRDLDALKIPNSSISMFRLKQLVASD